MRTSIRARSWRRVAIALATVAALGVGYALFHLLRQDSPEPIAQAEPAASPPAAASSVAPVLAPRAEAAAATPATAKGSPPVAAPSTSLKPTARPVPKRVAETPTEPTPAPVIARFAGATEPPAVVPAPEPVAAPPAPPRDRWQLMADAIAQCGREGFFAGVVCEQRVRLRYCDGYWGKAEQCPSGIPNDHGD